MKSYFLSLLFAMLAVSGIYAQQETAEDSTGYYGDFLSLEAVLDLFRQSESPEDFETKLNTESYGVNQLDLNEDGEVDYIHVEDIVEGDVHVLVLKVYVSEKEVQDIATIEIEITGKDEAMLQIMGDETVYGGKIVIEPFDEKAKSEGNRGGPDNHYDIQRVVVNVWGWPCVKYVYNPGYKRWVSPWRWRAYPNWWRPWRQRAYFDYQRDVFRHRSVYRRAPMRRVVVAQKIYKPHRRSSAVVKKRTTIIRKRDGSTTVKRTRVVRSRRN
jgi:hypothetical protein